MTSKRLFVKTYGCQMNAYDSQAIEGLLMEHGFTLASRETEADVILFNTCSVRDLAEQKVLGKAGIVSKLKRSNPDLVLGICGCMAQNMKEDLFRQLPHLDIVCGPNDITALPEMIHQVQNGRDRRLSVENPRWVMTSDMPKHRPGGVCAFISVMRGCNHDCTFCIVPRVRGREVSRSIEDVCREVRELVSLGYRETTLLGQNINSYGRDLGDGANFPRLLDAVNEINGLERIRFMTSHPVDIRDELIRAMQTLDKVCELLHFPIQSGSDRILQAMKRGYTRGKYLDKVKKVRDAMTDAAISTDVIVGFPGETQDDFMDTYRVLEETQFDCVYLFKYSIRSGTPASEMVNQVPEEIKDERLHRLMELQDGISLKKNQSRVGQTVEVLVEGQDKKKMGRLMGRTRDQRIVLFEGDSSLEGELIPIKIKKAKTYTLYGEVDSVSLRSLHSLTERE